MEMSGLAGPLPGGMSARQAKTYLSRPPSNTARWIWTAVLAAFAVVATSGGSLAVGVIAGLFALLTSAYAIQPRRRIR